MTLTLVYIIVAVLVIAWVIQKNWLPKVEIKPLSGRGKIVVFGDSLVAGKGSTRGHDIVSLLSKQFDRPIINAGRSGDTTAMALERLEKDVLAHKPELVVVVLGGNDAIQRLPREVTFANLKTIIDSLKQHNTQVIVTGIMGGLLYDKYARYFRRLARKCRVTLVPGILDGIFGYTFMMSDSVHPNNDGYALMASRIKPVLQSFLKTTEKKSKK